MLTIDVEYIMGRVIASSYHDRREVEFPPHPSRLFSSLVAAYEDFSLGGDARKALEWLETLPDPSLYAIPTSVENRGRDVLKAYVPVNDEPHYAPEIDKKNKSKIKLQPPITNGAGLNRLRAERVFPAITPDDPHVKFMWDAGDEAEMYIPALRTIAHHVPYLGNSMTPVAVRVDDSFSKPTLVPDPNGKIMLRTIGIGRLRHLEETYELRTKNPAIQPKIGKITAYSIASSHRKPVEAKNKFGNYITFRIDNIQSIPLSSAYILISSARNAFLSHYPEPIPEEISGHSTDGTPSEKHHLAVVAHPDVGHPYADGHIMGFSFLFPTDISEHIQKSTEYVAEQIRRISIGKLGVIGVKRVYADVMPNMPSGLKMRNLGRHSVWATVTPALLGKHPRKSTVGIGKDGGSVFREVCEMVGLPKPVEVSIGSASVFEGVPLARDFVIPEKFGKYLKTHLMIRFADPVQGPVILGAGRFSGFGLCKPYTGNE